MTDVMSHLTDRVLKYAKERFVSDTSDLLDDPSWLLRDDVAQTPAEYLAEWRALGADLGLDLDHIIDDLGTGFEIKRLREIEKGTYRP